jgi:hypothetical protein
LYFPSTRDSSIICKVTSSMHNDANHHALYTQQQPPYAQLCTWLENLCPSHIFASYLMLYPCFILILGIYQWPPLFWLQLRRTGIPCFVYFNFQGPKWSKIDQGFFVDYYFTKRMTWSTGTSREGPGGPKQTKWRGPGGGHPTHALSLLEYLQSSIQSPTSNSWPKNVYIKVPRRISERRRSITHKTPN